MKLSILNERLSDVLYHGTGLYSLWSILKTNEFHLTAAFGNKSERSVGSSSKLFFLSTSRSIVGSYTVKNAHHYAGWATLVLSGQKLGHRYTGQAVDYWSGFMRSTDNDEMEDRVFSNNPVIPNALSYISLIHIMIPKVMNERTRLIYRICLQHGIQTYLYDNVGAFLALDIRKAKRLGDLRVEPKSNDKPWPSYDSDASKKQEVRRKRTPTSKIPMQYGLMRWYILMMLPVNQYDRLNYNYHDMLRRASYKGFWRDETRSGMEADFHNEKRNHKWTKKLAPIMRQHNLKDLDDVFQFILNRWAPAVNATQR